MNQLRIECRRFGFADRRAGMEAMFAVAEILALMGEDADGFFCLDVDEAAVSVARGDGDVVASSLEARGLIFVADETTKVVTAQHGHDPILRLDQVA